MFIRYNDTIKFYEYDTSPGQTGAGPWLLLPLDFNKLINQPVIPPAVSYQEGTWLPVLTAPDGVGTAYGIQTGIYTKVGNLVTCSFDVLINAANWTSGTVILGGFPFPNTSLLPTAGVISYFIITGNVYSVGMYMFAGQTNAQLTYKNASSNTIDGNLQTGNIPAGARFIGSVAYRVA